MIPWKTNILERQVLPLKPATIALQIGHWAFQDDVHPQDDFGEVGFM